MKSLVDRFFESFSFWNSGNKKEDSNEEAEKCEVTSKTEKPEQ